MKNLEYSPLPDVNLSYVDYAGLSLRQRNRLLWEVMAITSLPSVSKWIIIKALKKRTKDNLISS